MKPTHVVFMPDWNGLGVDGSVDFQFAGADYFADKERVSIVSDASFDICFGKITLKRVRVAQPGWKSKVICFDGSDESFYEFEASCQRYVDGCMADGFLNAGNTMVNVSYRSEVKNIVAS